MPFQALACPLDGAPLVLAGAAWRCAAGHHFDSARQGYVNLLPVQHKRSRDPGDSKEMVAARRRFLASGHYRPIAALLAGAALAGCAPGSPLACLDAGCGEGYYLQELARAACANGKPLALLGLDISKWAVLAAAKQDLAATWVVGSNAKLPVQPGSLDRVLCLFGFPVYSEFARVLKHGGQLLQIDAGPAHLRELRSIIYPQLKAERAREMVPPPGFAVLPGESLSYRQEIAEAQQIADLLLMTPHFYRATAEGRARAAALREIAVTVDVRLTRLIRD